MIINLNSATGTGIWATTPGANGMISSTGPFAPNSRVRLSYSFSGSTSGVFAGLEPLFRGNFAQSIVFPGSYLKAELLDPVGYTSIAIEVVTS